ncbi:MAG TPA: hypothetical protein VJ123_02940 [Anaerolineales bacterium]|nr:hypothetical protein [Anaerolineales bacterium]
MDETLGEEGAGQIGPTHLNRIVTSLRSGWPVVLSTALAIAFLLWRLAGKGWDPRAIAELGTEYSAADPSGSEGYDGQFAYYMALDLRPAAVAPRLDVPAYRYQRILYPLLAHLLALGKAAWVPWTLILVNLVAHAAGTAFVLAYLRAHGRASRYALIYGLWVGLVLGIGADLYEPLAYALVAGGMLALSKGRMALGAAAISSALFAKETTLPFWGAMLAAGFLVQGMKRTRAATWIGGALFAAWQLWLWVTFGQIGIASGGALATPFEWIPYMGFLRLASVGLPVFAAYFLVFGPSVVLPSLWGAAVSLRALLSSPPPKMEALALLLNCLFLAVLPFSTYREPLGIVRVATGFVLAVVHFSAARGMLRPLNYGMFWIAFLAFIL